MNPDRPWRTLVRVESVTDASASVVLPAWNSRKPVTVFLNDLPADVRSRFAAGFRCHAHVNIGADNAADLRFTDWEAT